MTSVPAAAQSPAASVPASELIARLADLGRVAAWVGIVVLTLYMTVGEGSGWYGIYSVDLRIFTLASVSAVFALWGVIAWRQPAWRPRTALAPPILAVLGAFAIATATSWQPRVSLDYAAYAVLLAGLYLVLLRLLASPFFGPRLFGFAALLCAGIALWYLYTVATIWVRWWGLVGRFAIPPLRPGLDGLSWGSPNTVAIMVILLLPPVLAYFGGHAGGAGPASRRRVTALTALAALVLLTVFLTGSRGAWLGLGGGFAVTTVVWLAIPGHLGDLRQAATHLPIRRGRALLLGFVGAAAAVVAMPLILLRAGAGGEDLRAGFVQSALDMFRADPATGGGPGTWVVRRIAFTPADGTDYYVPHAHNIYAQTLAEFGLVGVLAGVVIVTWLAALIWDGLRDKDAQRRRFAWASLFSLSYFGLHQMVDVYVGSPCVLFALALSVGSLDVTSRGSLVRGLGRVLLRAGRIPLAGPEPGPKPKPKPKAMPRLLPGFALAAAIVTATAVLAWSESNALPADRAIGYANAGDWTSAAAAATTAASADPDFPAYQFILGLADLHTGDPAGAALAFARSVAADDFPQGWLNLAAARVQLGDAAGARDALTQAMRIGHTQPTVAFGAGSIYLTLGDRTAAIHALGAAIAVAPTLATDPWFQSGPGAGLREPAMGVALATWRPDGWDFALLAGDPQEAARRAANLPTAALQARALQIIAATQGDAAARTDLAAAAQASPFDLTLVGWNARLAREFGDEAAAQRDRDWANVITAASGAFGFDVRVSRDPGAPTADGGIDANVYGDYTYRRPMPADLLAPTLPHLELR